MDGALTRMRTAWARRETGRIDFGGGAGLQRLGLGMCWMAAGLGSAISDVGPGRTLLMTQLEWQGVTR